jgi:hypothetical protein
LPGAGSPASVHSSSASGALPLLAPDGLCNSRLEGPQRHARRLDVQGLERHLMEPERALVQRLLCQSPSQLDAERGQTIITLLDVGAGNRRGNLPVKRSEAPGQERPDEPGEIVRIASQAQDSGYHPVNDRTLWARQSAGPDLLVQPSRHLTIRREPIRAGQRCHYPGLFLCQNRRVFLI